MNKNWFAVAGSALFFLAFVVCLIIGDGAQGLALEILILMVWAGFTFYAYTNMKQ